MAPEDICRIAGHRLCRRGDFCMRCRTWRGEPSDVIRRLVDRFKGRSDRKRMMTAASSSADGGERAPG